VYRAYGWGGPPPAPKPGSIPLRPLGVGDILEGTFAVLRRYPGATLGSSAVIVGLVSLLQVLLLLPVISELNALADVAVQTTDPDRILDAVQAVPWSAVVAGSLLVGMLSFVLFVLLAGLLSVVVGQSVVGQPLSFGGAWSRLLPRLPRLLAAVLLVSLLVGAVWLVTTLVWVLVVAADAPAAVVALMVLLTVLVTVPLSIYLGVRLSLTTPAVALESTDGGPISPVMGVRRSWLLVSGAWWRTFGIVLLGGVIAGALAQVIAIPLDIVVSAASLDASVAVVASVVAAGVGQALALPISGLVLGLVYVDRRIRAERLDVALARAAGVDHLPGTLQQAQ